MPTKQRLTAAIRFAPAIITALIAGIALQSGVQVVVLTFVYPTSLRFFDSVYILIFYVPTITVLLTAGAPIFRAPKADARVGPTGRVIASGLLGALGASTPELYICTNRLMRCFLATPQDMTAGIGMILSGAACGAIVYSIYRRMAPVKSR